MRWLMHGNALAKGMAADGGEDMIGHRDLLD
jgi:hypothetical protein